MPTSERPCLRTLRIRRFRNAAPAELQFNRDFNVLLGQNAAGKTTLLDLIAACASSNFSEFEQTPFSVEYEVSGPLGTVRTTLENPGSKPKAANGPAEAILSGSPTLDLQSELEVRASTTMRTAAGTSCVITRTAR